MGIWLLVVYLMIFVFCFVVVVLFSLLVLEIVFE